MPQVEPPPSKIQRLAEFLGAGRRHPPTIRRWMATIALVAVVFGILAAGQTHLQRWEARRAEMALQADVTGAILHETMSELWVKTEQERWQPNMFIGPSLSRTRDWSITLNDITHDGPHEFARLRVAGGNGEFALKPITVEINDPRLRDPFLKRLEPAYRQRGWRFEVRSPN